MTSQCRADGLIDPDAIPGANIDAAKVETAGTAFSTSATDVETRGGEVKTAWAKLGSSYTTPDSADLLAVMDGVETDTAALAATLQKASTFIGDYATAVAPIAKRLVELKAEAEKFVEKALKGKTVGPWDPEHPANQGIVGLVQNFGEVLDDVHLPWDQYTPYVDENNELLTKVAEQETKLSAASAECVNAINGLRTDMCLATVQAVDYTAAVKANEPMPWGSTGRGDQSCQESFDSGVYDAAKGTVEGLGGLIGYNSQTGEWGDGDWAAQSWKGFAESLGLIVLMGSPPLLVAAALPKGVLPDVVGDTARSIMDQQKTLVEGFVGSPEDWRDDPAHAAGGAAFNIGTLFIPGAGEVGAGAKVAALGSRLAVLGADGSKLALIGSKVAAAGTTIVRVGDALSSLPGRALSGVSDLLARGRGGFADALRGLGDKTPTVKVSVEHAMATPDGFGVGVGRPHIEVGHPEPGSHWLHSVADRVDGGGTPTRFEHSPADAAASHSADPDSGTSHDGGVHGTGRAADENTTGRPDVEADGASPDNDGPESPSSDLVSKSVPDPVRYESGSVFVDGTPVTIEDHGFSEALREQGGLQSVEQLHERAHTLDRHYWGSDGASLKTDAEIASREPMPKSGNGAFRLNVDDLHRVIGDGIDANAGGVRKWLGGESPSSAFDAEFETVIGRHYGTEFTDSKSVRIVLQRDPTSPGGFYVKTAYPTFTGEG